LGPRPLDSRSKPTIRRRARRSTSRCHSRAAELLTRQPAFLQRPAPATRFRRAGGDDVPLRKGGMSYRTISRELGVAAIDHAQCVRQDFQSFLIPTHTRDGSAHRKVRNARAKPSSAMRRGGGTQEENRGSISLTLPVDERSLTGSGHSAFLSHPGRRRYGIFEITDLGSHYQRLFLQYRRPRAKNSFRYAISLPACCGNRR
jgi:hypothetical protein